MMFLWGGGARVGSKWKLPGGPGYAPPGNFRRFGLPWTAFDAFSWWTKREMEYRVAKRRSKSPPLHELLKVQLSRAQSQNNGWLASSNL